MTTPTREDLIKLRETDGMTREQIAEHYSVSLTTVRRWIKDLKIPRPTKQARNTRASHLTRFGEIVAEPDDGITVMERAQAILGTRLTERRGYGFYLDGKPANTAAVIHGAGLKFKDEE
jgi:transposase